jgi:predicted transcriptional regulator
MDDPDHSAPQDQPELVKLVARIAVAWLNNPSHQIAADEVPSLIECIHEGLATLHADGHVTSNAAQAASPEHIPAVSVAESLASKDYILSMIDGKPYKALRRHVAAYGLTPEEYRARYRLNPTYPMVAENHSATRRQLAERIGLGAMRKKT